MVCSKMKYYKSLEDLIECFQMFPGIGPKTAERLALFSVQKLQKEKVENFSEVLLNVLKDTKKCSVCGCLTDKDVCEVCSDRDREKTLLVVGSTKDIITFEKTGQYHGYYHALGGLISPLNGVSPQDINIDKLFERVKKENIKEVIVATSANIEGEMTALYIKNVLEKDGIKATRIGYGLPAGGDIEYADEITLIKALESRKEM